MKLEKCKQCNHDIEYEISGNFIVFCPDCRKYAFLLCEYGFGPVVPCKILLGQEEIAMVTYHDRNNSIYRYDSDKFHIHKVLAKTYLEALLEAKDITAFYLTPEIKDKNSLYFEQVGKKDYIVFNGIRYKVLKKTRDKFRAYCWDMKEYAEAVENFAYKVLVQQSILNDGYFEIF